MLRVVESKSGTPRHVERPLAELVGVPVEGLEVEDLARDVPVEDSQAGVE